MEKEKESGRKGATGNKKKEDWRSTQRTIRKCKKTTGTRKRRAVGKGNWK